MGIFDKIKSFIPGLGGAAASVSPVGAIAGAVGNIAGAVKAGEELADHKQLLNAGQAQGVINDTAKTEERIADAAAAHGDDKLRDSVAKTRFRD